MRHRLPTQMAFTIMELLIASVLASLLMVGVLFATTQMARQTQRQAKLDSPTRFYDLIHIIRADLKQTVSYKLSQNQIHLKGFFLLDDKTYQRRALPTEVIYRVIEMGDTFWMMRHQRELGKLTLEDTQANLLGKGIFAMQLTEVLIEDSKTPLPQENKPTKETETWQPLPELIELSLSTIQLPQTPLSFIITLK